MKIAVCKGGANITFSTTNRSAANADILYALRTLGIKDNDVTIVTHRTRNTWIPKPLKFQELYETKTFDDFDAVLLFNFSLNFFGGKEDIGVTQLYWALSKSDVPIFYVQTDGQLPFKPLWPNIHKREWAKKYAENEFFISEDRITYLTQGRNLTKVENRLKERGKNYIPSKFIHFPWERTILAMHEKYFDYEFKPFETRRYDLIYGGATRNTYRRKKIERFYNVPELSVYLFGNLRGVSSPNAIKGNRVSFQYFVRTLESGRSTIIIGDEFYENNFFTLRMYESILAGNLVFIDQDMDSKHLFYGPGIADNLYVKSPRDVVQAMTSDLQPLEDQAKELKNMILSNYSLENERQYLNEVIRDRA